MATQFQALPGRATLLRRVIQADALFEAVLGAILIIAAGPLSTLTGLGAPILIGAGIALLVVAAALVFLANSARVRQEAPAVAVANAAWVAISAMIPVGGWLPLTMEGVWLFLGIADAGAVFAALEFYALWRGRQPRPPPPSPERGGGVLGGGLRRWQKWT